MWFFLDYINTIFFQQAIHPSQVEVIQSTFVPSTKGWNRRSPRCAHSLTPFKPAHRDPARRAHTQTNGEGAPLAQGSRRSRARGRRDGDDRRADDQTGGSKPKCQLVPLASACCQVAVPRFGHTLVNNVTNGLRYRQAENVVRVAKAAGLPIPDVE